MKNIIYLKKKPFLKRKKNFFFSAKPPPKTISNPYKSPKEFVKWADPKTAKKCVPFRTNLEFDKTTITVCASAAIGTLRCSNMFERKTEEQLASKLYFIVYQK